VPLTARKLLDNYGIRSTENCVMIYHGIITSFYPKKEGMEFPAPGVYYSLYVKIFYDSCRWCETSKFPIALKSL